MKNSKEYAKKVAKLHCLLKQKHSKVKKRTFADPIESLVYGIISEHVKASLARRILGRNFNDLRVSRAEEIAEVIGASNEKTRAIASDLPMALNSVFNKFDMLDMGDAAQQGKRQWHKLLGELEHVSRFAANYCFVTAMDGHTIPLTQKMLDYLRENEYVNPRADDDEIAGFLERQIAATSGYEFYALLKRECETTRKKGETKTKAKTKTRAKAGTGAKTSTGAKTKTKTKAKTKAKTKTKAKQGH